MNPLEFRISNDLFHVFAVRSDAAYGSVLFKADSLLNHSLLGKVCVVD